MLPAASPVTVSVSPYPSANKPTCECRMSIYKCSYAVVVQLWLRVLPYPLLLSLLEIRRIVVSNAFLNLRVSIHCRFLFQTLEWSWSIVPG